MRLSLATLHRPALVAARLLSAACSSDDDTGTGPTPNNPAPIGLAVDWPGVPSLTWAGLLWAVVISSFAGWLVWGWVNAVRGVARTAPLMYLMPAVAGLVSWVVADERFSMVKLAGAALTLAGVAAAQFSGNAGKARLRKDG